MIVSPYFWLALLVGALALSSVSYHYGGKHARDEMAAGNLNLVNKAITRANKAAKRMEERLEGYEAKREKIRLVYRKAEEQADDNISKNPGYGDCGLDADGLHLYNARPNFDEPGVGVPDGTMPGTARSAGREAINNSQEQH